jgi:nicotinamide-nucleotide amidase
MLAEILTIGDELCRGEIVDTNSSWLAAALWELDITVAWMTSCRDLAADIALAVRQASARAPLVLVSGGLGPTEDDLTVDVVSVLAGVVPDIHQPSLSRMTARFASANFRLTPNNMRQVRVPGGSRVFINPAGLAPGFEVACDGAHIICMPGPPRELRALWESEIGSRVIELRDQGGGQPERIARRVYHVFGQGESHIGSMLEGALGGAAGASLHFQVVFPETLVKVVVRDPDPTAAATRLEVIDTEVRKRLGAHLYGVGDDSLGAALGRALAERGATLAAAESCTGGMIGALITAVPGSSRYYLGGAVVYHNREKVRQLGVSEETLARAGSVSEECAREMARGVRDRTKANWGVAVTGIAGPDGGTEEKPVGLVHIAVAGPNGAERAMHFIYPGARDQVRGLAAHWALALTLREVTKNG